MGFRFRKSFNMGGLRINLSRSGIGYSVRVAPGLRVGVGPRGTRTITAGIPGTGIYYTKQISRRSTQNHEQLQRNLFEVQEFENQLEMLKSVHKECTNPVNWLQEKATPRPFEGDVGPLETLALKRLNEYKPSFFDRLLKREEEKKKELERKVEEAREMDQKTLEDWKVKVELAERVLKGDPTAYLHVLKNEKPFDNIAIDSKLDIEIDSKRVEIAFRAESEEIIPQEEKVLTKTGRLSIKKMTKTKRYDIYQDYVCSCAIRIAREIFALLPVDVILVHALSDFIDTSTGHTKEETILSVRFTRDRFQSVNFDLIDCADFVSTFPHNMKFLKTKGFQPVEQLDF